MVDTADNVNLSLELSVSLASGGFEALDSNFLAIGEKAFVDISETTLAEEVALGEASGGSRELVVSEGALVESKCQCGVWGWQHRT